MDILKRLGGVAPSATTETDLYTVPALTQTTTSSLVVCNRDGGGANYRVSVSVGGAATATKDYLFYQYNINAHITDIHVMGLTLGPGDVVRVYASNANLSFSLFGVETSNG